MQQYVGVRAGQQGRRLVCLLMLIGALGLAGAAPTRADLAVPACSPESVVASSVTFQNVSSRAVTIFWIDSACEERAFATLAPGISAGYQSFVSHLWRVRDAQSGALRREIVLTSPTPRTVQIGDGPPVLSRVATNRPDEAAGYQVQVLYVLPSDGVDQALDSEGTLAMSVAAFRHWFVQQTGGATIRFDTFQGALDIVFVRLGLSDAQLRAEGVRMRDKLESELTKLGFNEPQKIYAAYYGGGHDYACADGPIPPELVGHVVATYLNGLPNTPHPCAANPFATAVDQPGYREFAMVHEIVHALGFVASCAPNYYNTHVGDKPTDLMYAGDDPWQPQTLDVGRDDYFGHSNAACLDLADSAFLDPLPAGAQPPPGWPAPTPSGCAPQSTTPVTITFVNASRRTVSIVWLNDACEEQPLASLSPGATASYESYVSHRWRIRDAQTGTLRREVVLDSAAPLTVRIADWELYLPLLGTAF